MRAAAPMRARIWSTAPSTITTPCCDSIRRYRDILNARGELWRKKGDRPKALADFGAAIKLNPDHPSARGNYKSLAQEVERLGALMAVAGKPSFNCGTARRAVEKAICANPELADLDREINAVNTKVVRQATRNGPRAGRALQREQDEFIARRNAAFGRPDYDLRKAMQERLDHLLAVERGIRRKPRPDRLKRDALKFAGSG